MDTAVLDIFREHTSHKKALLEEASTLISRSPHILTDQERLVDEKIKLAANELRSKLPTEFYSNPMKYKEAVESSELYKLVKKAPKGSLHHIHFDCFASSTWVTEYMRQNADKYRYSEKACKFFHYKNPEAKDLADPSDDAKNLTKEEFHAKYLPYFEFTLSEINEAKNIWEFFELHIMNRLMIIQPKTAYYQYTKASFEEAIEHGLQNIQGRVFLDFMKDDDLKDIPHEEQMQLYLDVQAEVQKTNPEFIFTAVLQGLRFWPNDKIKEYLTASFEMKKKFPELINGFDMVAEEDMRALSDMIPTFLEFKKLEHKDCCDNFSFLLHAGESLNPQCDNMVDAVLFGCPRIGHGYNLYRHPILLEKLKSNKICIEWNPLSNQILRYVKDMRNHPHFGSYKQGVVLSISSDDPGIFGTDPATWDLVSVVLSFKLGLADLKVFFENSIDSCCLNQRQQDSLRSSWSKLWKNYLDAFN